jgi:hypothetical protein
MMRAKCQLAPPPFANTIAHTVRSWARALKSEPSDSLNAPTASPVPRRVRHLAKRMECGAFRRFCPDFVNGP